MLQWLSPTSAVGVAVCLFELQMRLLLQSITHWIRKFGGRIMIKWFLSVKRHFSACWSLNGMICYSCSSQCNVLRSFRFIVVASRVLMFTFVNLASTRRLTAIIHSNIARWRAISSAWTSRWKFPGKLSNFFCYSCNPLCHMSSTGPVHWLVFYTCRRLRIEEAL